MKFLKKILLFFWLCLTQSQLLWAADTLGVSNSSQSLTQQITVGSTDVILARWQMTATSKIQVQTLDIKMTTQFEPSQFTNLQLCLVNQSQIVNTLASASSLVANQSVISFTDRFFIYPGGSEVALVATVPSQSLTNFTYCFALDNIQALATISSTSACVVGLPTVTQCVKLIGPEMSVSLSTLTTEIIPDSVKSTSLLRITIPNTTTQQLTLKSLKFTCKSKTNVKNLFRNFSLYKGSSLLPGQSLVMLDDSNQIVFSVLTQTVLPSQNLVLEVRVDVPFSNSLDSCIRFELQDVKLNINELSSMRIINLPLQSECILMKKTITQAEKTFFPSNVDVYLNPATDDLTVSCSGEVHFEITILNASGQPIFTDRFAKETRVDISTFAKGIYFIRLQDGEGRWSLKKIIKN